MTEAFARFVASESGPNEGWEDVHPLSRIAAHFWLSAFMREVERRYKEKMFRGAGSVSGAKVLFADAMNDVVREFGLDGEGEK